jgi:hypothetical protein
LGNGSDDEMSDGPLFVWGADEHGSDVEEDPADGDPTLRSLPPPAPGLGPKSVDERVRELWMKYMRDHKIKSQGTDLESTPFAPWADVGDVQDLRPRMQFEGKPGMRNDSNRPERAERKNDWTCFEFVIFAKNAVSPPNFCLLTR